MIEQRDFCGYLHRLGELSNRFFSLAAALSDPDLPDREEVAARIEEIALEVAELTPEFAAFIGRTQLDHAEQRRLNGEDGGAMT